MRCRAMATWSRSRSQSMPVASTNCWYSGTRWGGLSVLGNEGADGLEIDVDDAVGLGQQARGLGRGLGAQKDGHGQQSRTAATIKSVLRVRRFMRG